MPSTAPRKLSNALDLDRARATDKPLRLRFGDGLFCVVTPAGTKTWKTDYWRDGKHFEIVLGHHPDMRLIDAKAARLAVRKTVRAGGNPKIEQVEQRAQRAEADATTVRAIAPTWISRMANAHHWTPAVRRNAELRLAKHVYPAIGDRPIGRVTTQEIEALIWRIADRAPAMAVHVRQHLTGLFDYAVAHRLAADNPVRRIATSLPRRIAGDEREQQHAYVATIEDARAVLRALETSSVRPFTKLAHRLIALTAVRKMEAIGARWSEIDLGTALWTIPAARMKGKFGRRRAHRVPLSPQAVELFRAARRFADQLNLHTDVVFPALHHRSKGATLSHYPLNEALGRLLPPLGLRHVIHGWRSTFYTLMKRRDRRDEPIIDLMLAHKPLRPSLAAEHYDGTGDDLPDPDRLRLACAWADMLLDGAPSAFALIGEDEARAASNVIELRRAVA